MSWIERLPWVRRRAEREAALHHSKAVIAQAERKLAEAEHQHDRASRVKDRLDETLAENKLRIRMERAFGVDR